MGIIKKIWSINEEYFIKVQKFKQIGDSKEFLLTNDQRHVNLEDLTSISRINIYKKINNENIKENDLYCKSFFDFDDSKEKQLNNTFWNIRDDNNHFIQLDLFESNNEFLILFDVNEISDLNEITIKFSNESKTFHINYNKKPTKNNFQINNYSSLINERKFGNFYRNLLLPTNLNFDDNFKTFLENGLLKVLLTKEIKNKLN
jgi:HSP20 family molecular chaperone IbpA